eukprot:1158390-Pelagomonas_calceolata.AAC.3
MGRLQDLCLQAEERAHSAERRASVADARCTRAENGLREANAAIKEREKSLTGAQAEIKSLQAKLAAAESQGGGGSGVAASNASHQEEVSKLEKQDVGVVYGGKIYPVLGTDYGPGVKLL